MLIAAGSVAAPVLLIALGSGGTAEVDLPATIDPGAEHYPDAVERLEATSQMLTTVVLAILAATGILIAKEKTPRLISRIAAAIIFTFSVVSMFFATRLGYAAALTLAAEQGDITPLATILDSQGLYTLLAGLLLGALVAGGSARDEGHLP